MKNIKWIHDTYKFNVQVKLYYKIKIINHILFLSYNLSFEFKQIITEIILIFANFSVLMK